MKFEVLMAVNNKIKVFWVMVPCNPVDIYKRFRGTYCSFRTYCLHHMG